MHIPRAAIATLTPAALRAHIARANMPLVLKGLTSSWPKTSTWAARDANNKPTLDALRALVGEDTAVDVEVGKRGRGYLDPDWQRVTMGFGLFLDAFVLGRIPSTDPSSLPVGYLAQADLLDSCSPLTHAVPELAHFRAGPSGDVYRRTLWVGPGGSFTPFHRDPNIGIYTQVVGAKTFHLLPPEAEKLLELSERRTNTSTVPISVRRIMAGEGGEELPPRVLERCRRNLEEAFGMEGACEAKLDEGDSVFIPQGWWHSAEGESVGVGVNAWFR